MMDMGSAAAGMKVAERLRRNRKITRITSTSASTSVNCTSCTESRMPSERSYSTSTSMPGGICARNCGSSLRISSTTWTVLVPGWRWIASTMPRLSLYQAAMRLFCTSSMACPMSLTRTGAPLR